jgi:protein-disulfide isomerase
MKLEPLRRSRRFYFVAILILGSLAWGPLGKSAVADDDSDAAARAALDQTVNTLLTQPAVVDFLLKHPDAVIDALQATRAREIIAQKRQDLFDNADDLVAGNATGDVTIVEFFDYRCPFCKQVEPVLDALLREDKKLRVVYKEFPVLGEASTFATRIALASRAQGKYAAFHHAMIAAKGDISDALVLKVAASVGIDIDQAKAAMNSPDIERIIQDNFDLADALYVQGTPAIIVGTTMIPGAVDIAALRHAIAAARKGS